MRQLVKNICYICLVLFLSVGLASLPKHAQAQLSVWGKAGTYCGQKLVPLNPTKLPSLGCFQLSSGHSAKGIFAGNKIDLSITEQGQEVVKANGVVVTNSGGSTVRLGGAGYLFCSVAASPTNPFPSSCATQIDVFSRNPDKSVLFIVSECVLPQYQVCASDQDNLDFLEKSYEKN